MDNPKIFPNVVDYAYEIIRMNNRIAELEEQVERLEQYKTDYFVLLNESSQQTKQFFKLAVAATLGDHDWAQKIADS
jgi:uncharacterized protein YutD